MSFSIFKNNDLMNMLTPLSDPPRIRAKIHLIKYVILRYNKYRNWVDILRSYNK